MRFRTAVLVFALFASPQAHAQQNGAIPAALASAGVTQAQWETLQVTVNAQARTLGLRDEVIRTLAIEVFQAQPGQPIERYTTLIREGSTRLPQAIAAAQALDPGADPKLVDLKTRAVTAAQAGRLNEARSLQDEYASTLRTAIQRATMQPMLALAAADSAAADSAYALGDYLDAAQRYERAANDAPASETHVVWGYRMSQANALRRRGTLFVEPDQSRGAVALYRTIILPLAPREARPEDWAATQQELGRTLAGLDDPQAREEAVAAYRASLQVYTRTADPAKWAAVQSLLAQTLLVQGSRGDDEQTLRSAVEAYRNAVEVLDPASPEGRRDRSMLIYLLGKIGFDFNDAAATAEADAMSGAPAVEESTQQKIARARAQLQSVRRASSPRDWASAQWGLGDALAEQGRQGDAQALRSSVTAYREALEVFTREASPSAWASVQSALGSVLLKMGENGDDQALRDSVIAFRAAMEVTTREVNLEYWTLIQASMCNALALLVDRGDSSRLPETLAAVEAAQSGYEQLGDASRAQQYRSVADQLRARMR